MFITIVAYLVAAEMILGGQARLTNLTPGIRQKTLDKAEGYQRLLPIIPIKDPVLHSAFLGFFMSLGGILLLFRSTRRAGSVLTGTLNLLGVYVQSRIGIGYSHPVISAACCALVYLYT